MACLPILVVTGFVAGSIACVNNICQVWQFYKVTDWEEVTTSVKVAVGLTVTLFAIKVVLSPWVIVTILGYLLSFLWKLALCLEEILGNTIAGFPSFLWYVVAFLDDVLTKAVVGMAYFAFGIIYAALKLYALVIFEVHFWGALFIYVPTGYKAYKVYNSMVRHGPRVAKTREKTSAPTAAAAPAMTKKEKSSFTVATTQAKPVPTAAMREKPTPIPSTTAKVESLNKSTCRFCL